MLYERQLLFLRALIINIVTCLYRIYIYITKLAHIYEDIYPL